MGKNKKNKQKQRGQVKPTPLPSSASAAIAKSIAVGAKRVNHFSQPVSKPPTKSDSSTAMAKHTTYTLKLPVNRLESGVSKPSIIDEAKQGLSSMAKRVTDVLQPIAALDSSASKPLYKVDMKKTVIPSSDASSESETDDDHLVTAPKIPGDEGEDESSDESSSGDGSDVLVRNPSKKKTTAMNLEIESFSSASDSSSDSDEEPDVHAIKPSTKIATVTKVETESSSSASDSHPDQIEVLRGLYNILASKTATSTQSASSDSSLEEEESEPQPTKSASTPPHSLSTLSPDVPATNHQPTSPSSSSDSSFNEPRQMDIHPALLAWENSPDRHKKIVVTAEEVRRAFGSRSSAPMKPVAPLSGMVSTLKEQVNLGMGSSSGVSAVQHIREANEFLEKLGGELVEKSKASGIGMKGKENDEGAEKNVGVMNGPSERSGVAEILRGGSGRVKSTSESNGGKMDKKNEKKRDYDMFRNRNSPSFFKPPPSSLKPEEWELRKERLHKISQGMGIFKKWDGIQD